MYDGKLWKRRGHPPCSALETNPGQWRQIALYTRSDILDCLGNWSTGQFSSVKPPSNSRTTQWPIVFVSRCTQQNLLSHVHEGKVQCWSRGEVMLRVLKGFQACYQFIVVGHPKELEKVLVSSEGWAAVLTFLVMSGVVLHICIQHTSNVRPKYVAKMQHKQRCPLSKLKLFSLWKHRQRSSVRLLRVEPKWRSSGSFTRRHASWTPQLVM